MGLMFNRLRRERTNASGKRPTITMNAPGVYIPRYGKYKLTISGQGEPGVAAQPGTVAYYNPDEGGNVYYNPDRIYGSSYTVYYDTTNRGTDTSYGDRPWGPSASKPPTQRYSANPGSPGNSVVTYNYEGTTPGNRRYNPTTPGNAEYNPAVAAKAGMPYSVMGVTFPGGGVGLPGGVVANTPVVAKYEGPNVGVTISVPPGGSVTLKET